MIHAEASWDSPSVRWTLESTDEETGFKIVKDKEGVVTETAYDDKDAAQTAWDTLNEEMIQQGYTP